MWQLLSELSEEHYQHVASLGNGSTQNLAHALMIVATRSYANQLSVVTQMGHLVLTTAKIWDENLHHRWRHPQIAIRLQPDALVLVEYFPQCEPSSAPTASHSCKTPQEVAEYIDILMNRMPYDADKAAI